MDRFQEAKLRVKEATDLVALIESYMPLRARGRTMVALCPFHSEGSPSFTVYPENQSYYCFGCGKHGDAFDWLQEREGLSFREAFERLAERAGVSLEGVFRSEAPRQKGPDPYDALGKVREFFMAALRAPGAAPVREYLASRGLADVAAQWGLGAHPAGGALRQMAQKHGVPFEVLEQAGLLRHDREPYTGRLMFPIEDERGRVVGFGGRVVPGMPGNEGDGDYKPPKYINSQESPWFNKRKVLFGLGRAKQAGQRRIVVVEGYTDVIACHAAGFPGAVAALGTAFTQDHARTIERYASDGVVLLFDGDRAGQQAAERAFGELIESPLSVRMVVLENVKDPAEMLLGGPDADPERLTENRARFADLLDGAEDALQVWFRLLRKRLRMDEAGGVERAAHDCGSLLDRVHNPVRRAALQDQMARHLAVPGKALEQMLRQRPSRQRQETPAAVDGGGEQPPALPDSPAARAELELLACVLGKPELAARAIDGPFVLAAVGELLQLVQAAVALGRTTGAEVVRYLYVVAAERPELRAVLGPAVNRAQGLGDADQFFTALQRGRQRAQQDQNVRRIRQDLQAATAAGDQATADELTRLLVAELRQSRAR